jgi:hypothetical protein
MVDKLIEAKRENGQWQYGRVVKEYQTFIVVKFLDGIEEPISNGDFDRPVEDK